MSRVLLKLTGKDGKDWYLEWSTVCDAPTTFGTTDLEEFKLFLLSEHLKKEREDFLREWPDRMARVEATGTSSHQGDTPAQLIDCNQAGPDGKSLGIEGIIERYCTGPWRDRQGKVHEADNKVKRA